MRFFMNCVTPFLAVAIGCSMCAPAAAQNPKLPPGALQDKKVQVGYGLDHWCPAERERVGCNLRQH